VYVFYMFYMLLWLQIWAVINLVDHLVVGFSDQILWVNGARGCLRRVPGRVGFAGG
jgi:hypothetical protein